ncbi:MAG: insulinase family protein, partial [Deltaproteobacteria bacterium]|nr:insulinase family protein [Deltaproteobacteria bacterium]
TCSAQAQNLSLCLKMVASLVARPTFPKKEMSQVARQLEGMVRADRDDPSMLAAKHFYNQLYGDDHPAGRPLTLAGIQAITRKDLLHFYKTHYRPGDAVLAITGAINTKTLPKALSRAFLLWTQGKRPPRHVTPVKDPPRGLRVLLVDKPDLTQSFFALGHAGVSFRNPDRDALRVANYVLGGGGFSSRLMKVVRSQGGKTYGINSAFYAHEADGVFRVRSETRNPEIVRTLALVRQELRRIESAPPTTQEIVAAKGQIAGGFALPFKTGAQVAAALALAQVRHLGDAYVSEFPLRIDHLTATQIASALKKHLHPDHLVAAIVGRGAVVAPLLDAAKIPYERISYLAPISARQRKKAKRAVTISPADAKAGRALLRQALRAAGGRRALAKITSARLRGKLTRQTPAGPMVSRYEAVLWPPSHLLLSFELGGAAGKDGPRLKMQQVLADKGSFMAVNGKKRPLPPQQVAALRRSLFRHPVFVLQNATAKGTRLRPSHDPAIDKKTQRGLDVFPPHGLPLTLIFDKKTSRLIGLREGRATGKLRASVFSKHGKDKRLGVWLPYKQTAKKGRLVVEITSITLNPKDTKTAFAP